MAAAVAGDHAAGGAEQRIRVENAAGEATEKLRIGFGRIELAEDNLAVRPGELEDAIGRPVDAIAYPHGDADPRVADAARGTGYVLGAATDLVLPELRSVLATPSFVLQLGEPAMILWLLLGGATRGRAPAGAPAAA